MPKRRRQVDFNIEKWNIGMTSLTPTEKTDESAKVDVDKEGMISWATSSARTSVLNC